MGGGCLNFGKIEKYWIWWLLKFKKKNRKSSKKIPDSPPLQQAAFDPINELTGLCRVHTFSTLVYFLPKST